MKNFCYLGGVEKCVVISILVTSHIVGEHITTLVIYIFDCWIVSLMEIPSLMVQRDTLQIMGCTQIYHRSSATFWQSIVIALLCSTDSAFAGIITSGVASIL